MQPAMPDMVPDTTFLKVLRANEISVEGLGCGVIKIGPGKGNVFPSMIVLLFYDSVFDLF